MDVVPAAVGTMGIYINITPYGTKKLENECLKKGKDINSPCMPTWGVKSMMSMMASLESTTEWSGTVRILDWTSGPPTVLK